MLVKNIIEKLQQNGYDTFYWASLVDKCDKYIFLGLWCLIIIGINHIIKILDGDVKTLLLAFQNSIITLLFLIVLPKLIMAVSKNIAHDRGNTDIRLTWIFTNLLSKLMLWIVKFAPFFAVVYLVYTFWGIPKSTRTFVLFIISLSLIILSIIPYRRLLSKIVRNSVCYVDWKKDHLVRNFDEYEYSRRDLWRTPAAYFEFEKQNTDRYRTIEYITIIGYVCLPIMALYMLSATLPTYFSYRKSQTENVIKNNMYNSDDQCIVESESIDEEAMNQSDDEKVIEDYNNSSTSEKWINLSFSGYIGKYSVSEMQLYRDGHDISGYYRYDLSDSQLQINGTIQGNHIELFETNNEGINTGHFVGECIDGIFSGEFINYKKQRFDFHFTAVR